MLDRFGRRFIAGPALERALVLVREDNLLGVYGILNYLGEHTKDVKEVDAAIAQYVEAIQEIKRRQLDAQLSVKLTQLGLLISEEICTKSLSKVLQEAQKANVFVWIDIESSVYTTPSLVIYSNLVQQYNGLGITLQAMLARTEVDLNNLLLNKGTVRLVKGAYKEKKELLVGDRGVVRENYRKLLQKLFEGGGRFAVATHDDILIQQAIALSEEYEAEPEFQLLLGVREGLQMRLAADGYRVGEYIPYGRQWFPYFRRRVREKKTNALLALKDFFMYRHERLTRL